MLGRLLAAIAALVLMLAPTAHAQDPGQVVSEGIREQSCRSLQGGTAGIPERTAAEPGAGIPPTWPEAPAGLLPDAVHLRTPAETFNRRYEFATRGGEIYARSRGDRVAWRQMPLPPCFAGRVASISLDDDELIALDTARRVYTMDNSLKDASLFNWTSRWGTPFWAGPGYTLPDSIAAWSWSVISLVEDGTWTDPAGNRTAVGDGKVSHIWGLRAGGQRLTFWDPWLPLDESYEMCGPHRGRFRAVNLSASGSMIFVVGHHGDLFTRLYDFDLSGHDELLFPYSYEDQRGKGDGAPIQLPAAPWVEQPKIPGTITSAISVHKVGMGAIHRILRVEGESGGRTGYWERDVAAPAEAGWEFHATGRPLTGRRLDNPRRDTSEAGLGPGEDTRWRTEDGSAELLDYNVYCSPARLVVRDGRGVRELRLHHLDGVRQQTRSRGLDETPRNQWGVIEGPSGKFSPATVYATRDEILVEETGWRFRRVASAPPPSDRCLPRRARLGRRGVGPVRLGVTQSRLLRRTPGPARVGDRSWRWCVDGGGSVIVTFTKGGRAALVATTATGHAAGPLRAGAPAAAVRRAYRGSRAIVPGVLRAGPRSRLVVGVRRGKVRFLAAAARGTVAPRSLTTHLRRAGLR
jgi:hypothetical protein